MSDVTRLLTALHEGNASAASDLLQVVYSELRKLAAAKMAREPAGHTLQPTALVHEAWMRLAKPGSFDNFENRSHFFGAAAEAMRRILIESARRKLARRRGAGAEHVAVDNLDIEAPTGNESELLAIHEALDKLAAHDSRKAELVKLRYFGGLTLDQAADILGISVPTAKRDWSYARAWLFRELQASR